VSYAPKDHIVSKEKKSTISEYHVLTNEVLKPKMEYLITCFPALMKWNQWEYDTGSYYRRLWNRSWWYSGFATVQRTFIAPMYVVNAFL